LVPFAVVVGLTVSQRHTQTYTNTHIFLPHPLTHLRLKDTPTHTHAGKKIAGKAALRQKEVTKKKESPQLKGRLHDTQKSAGKY